MSAIDRVHSQAYTTEEPARSHKVIELWRFHKRPTQYSVGYVIILSETEANTLKKGKFSSVIYFHCSGSELGFRNYDHITINMNLLQCRAAVAVSAKLLCVLIVYAAMSILVIIGAHRKYFPAYTAIGMLLYRAIYAYIVIERVFFFYICSAGRYNTG